MPAELFVTITDALEHMGKGLMRFYAEHLLPKATTGDLLGCGKD